MLVGIPMVGCNARMKVFEEVWVTRGEDASVCGLVKASQICQIMSDAAIELGITQLHKPQA